MWAIRLGMSGDGTVEGSSGTGGARLPALDGLRGLAALVVLLHHATLVAPTFADAHLGERLDGTWQTLIYSPLYVVVAGGEAVFVFFVLSGFVLARPYVRSGPQPLAYYPKRILRLYLPICGAAVVAFVLRAASHDPVAGGSWWVNRHADAPTLGGALAGTVLLVGPATRINSALWSLKYEVVFSLLLPLYLVGARLVGRWRWALAALCVLCVVVSGIAAARVVPADRYAELMPMFGLGVVLAFAEPRLGAVLGRLRGRGWAGALVGATVVLLTAPWSLLLATRPGHAPAPVLLGAGRAAALVGAGLAVVLAATWAPAGRVLAARVMRDLGARSYSLYLVHVPVIVLLATALDVDRPNVATFLGSIVASLLVAEVFHRVVERPSVNLARAWGDALSRRVRAPSSRALPSA